MKRGNIFLCWLLFIILITSAIAQDEFSVRFHSFGKNATIDLKQYLGESEYYLASQTLNVIINIDQEKGRAYLEARPGWEGSEVIFFRKNESFKKIQDTEEIAKFLPAVPEILALRRIRDEELAKLFEGTIDPSILDLIKEIKKEEIRKMYSEIEKNLIKINVNDEVDLKLELGYAPTVSIDFSLRKEIEGVEEIEPEKEVGFELNRNIIIALLAIIFIISIYSYIKYSKRKKERKKEEELEHVISKDVKLLSIYKLRKLQKEIGKAKSSEFINIMREFFSRYFGIEYNFEFNHLIRRVKDSDISGHMKHEIIDFLDIISKIVYHPTEKWTEIYGEGQIPKKELKKLITKMKRIIRNL